MKAKFIDFMVKHIISWSNAGEIPPGFLHEMLKLIMEKMKSVFISLQALYTLHNSILYSDCQIHFSASTKHLINDKLPKQMHYTILLLHIS